MQKRRYVVEEVGAGLWLAHHDEDGHDCLADETGAAHAQADHPTAALRALLKQEGVQ